MSLLANLDKDIILELLSDLEKELERPLLNYEQLYFLEQLRRINMRQAKLVLKHREKFASSLADNLAKANGETWERSIKKEMDLKTRGRVLADNVRVRLPHGEAADVLFNPKSRVKSVLFELNSRNRDITGSNDYELKWTVGPGPTKQGHLQSQRLGRIVGIAMDEIRFPQISYGSTILPLRSMDFTLLIKEFSSQAFFTSGQHFHFIITRNTNIRATYDGVLGAFFSRYEPRGNFMFNEPFTDLTSITLMMARGPVKVKALTHIIDVPYTDLSTTDPAVITWSTNPSRLYDGSLIQIKDFTTANPQEDADLIEQVNQVHVATGDKNSCSFPVDLTGVTLPDGTFQVDVFDSPIICQLRVYYLEDETTNA
jgi:hypothetical protein